MIPNVLDFVLDLRDRQRIAIALARGAAGLARRTVDLTLPHTWEFGGFSQNGEDGILDVLLGRMACAPSRYFLEVGAADGIENNSAWLAVVAKYSGIMVEGNPRLVRRAQRTVMRLVIGAEMRNLFVTRDSARGLASDALSKTPDVLSIDIDGNDLHIARVLLGEGGLRPRIVVAEYNSVFGESRSITIPYSDDFAYGRAHPSELYYGASIAAWRTFLEAQGYRFVTVDACGVNAFFIDPSCFDADFLAGVRGLAYAENQYQLRKFRVPSAEQFRRIEALPFVDVA